ncbi:MAG TPA: substrate-binding domain-containing protein [Methanoregulaceae archaeon]|nr:substrate-binding domain-containing protein [Methanoregulaceae archaeon]HPD10504.1 substrate-binding domain-containing protein [Methanoregulaceae archaeon]HRT15522.1 substrate-binding domain-containing protein [Methanoregulaceae archaeon]HRU31088.1 substrate-binding domain-containing protein [Methanoregulaceae archaeon]
MKRRYFSLTSFDDAIRILKETFPAPGVTERVSLEQAVGRVTAEPVYAPFSVPEVNLSSMDGIAVRSADTAGAMDRHPVTLEHFQRVNTGQVIPQGFDAVIMIEDVWVSDGTCKVRKSAFPGQFIRPAGEDIRKGELVLPRGHIVRPFDVGALATYGIPSLLVSSVSIGLIPIGDELVPPGVRPKPGAAVESNTLFAHHYFSGMGASCHRYPITRDEPESITAIMSRAIRDHDLVLLFGGSSAGTRDYADQVISSCGTLLFHGVGMKPGTPVMLGSVEKKPVFGVPGFPIAAACVIKEFVARLLEWWGLAPYPIFTIRAELAQRIASDLGYEEFVHVSAARVGNRVSVMPHSRGNGIHMSLVRSDGFIQIPASYEGYEAGEEVPVQLTIPPAHLDRNLLVCGTRDECIHTLGDLLTTRGFSLHCCNTLDSRALLTLREKRCHAASVALPRIGSWVASNLFDPVDNTTFVRVTVAEAELGLASRSGIVLDDLIGVRFINRPRGTTARTLTDEILLSSGITPQVVPGYENQVRSEEGVITAIQNGSADTGVCRKKTAEISALSWTPLGYESYNLVIPLSYLEDPATIGIISILKSGLFRDMIGRTGGYSTAGSGQVSPVFPTTV